MIDTLKGWLAAIAIGLVAVAVYFIRKSGGDAERAQQAQADLKAANTVAVKRDGAKAATDADLNKKVDRWTRK